MTKPLTITERLRENDETLTRLEISSHTIGQFNSWQLSDFVRVLEVNQHVETIHLSGKNLHSESMPELLQAVGKCASLKEFFIFQGNNPNIDGKALASIVHKAKHLQVLMMWGFSDMDADLAGALRHHPAIRRITLTLPHRLPYASWDVFAVGLSQLETLKCLQVRCEGGTPKESIVSPEAISILLASQHIESLYLENIGLTDDHTDVIADELKTNKCLKLLDLKHNCFSDDPLHAFALAIPLNNTIESIDLSGVTVTESGVNKLTKAMEHNSSIKHLELEGDADRWADEFNVPKGHSETPYMRALYYRLRLNRAGQGQSDRKRFVESLVSVNDMLDGVYKFVREFPQHARRPEVWPECYEECHRIRQEYYNSMYANQEKPPLKDSEGRLMEPQETSIERSLNDLRQAIQSLD